MSDLVKEKLRQANLGKKQSKETIAKRSRKIKIAMRGNKNGNKSVRCVETGIVFDSVKLAAESLGIAPSNITHCLKGEQKTAGTYHWEYHNSVETNRDECSDVGEKNELLLEVHGTLNG